MQTVHRYVVRHLPPEWRVYDRLRGSYPVSRPGVRLDRSYPSQAAAQEAADALNAQSASESGETATR